MGELLRFDVTDRGHYASISNHAARNKALSRSAKGLLFELCSHSSEFPIRHRQLLNAATDGKTRLQRSVDELKTHGYLAISEIRDGGKYVGSRWCITTDPDHFPLEDFGGSFPPEPQNEDAATVSSLSGPRKRGHIRKTKQKEVTPISPATQIDLLGHTNGNGSSPPKAKREDFDALWGLYRKGPKRQAWDQYREAVPSKVSETLLLASASLCVNETDHKYLKDLFRWIRDERWQEYAQAATAPVQPTKLFY